MVIGIIGAGASGMAAALAAAEHPGVQVVLLERQARVGRKLGATGNGRCNLTNTHALEGGYHGDEADFVYILSILMMALKIIATLTMLYIQTGM